MEVTDSDHKPVRCKFSVEVSRVDRSVRRREFGKIFQYNDKIRSILEELYYIPVVAVNTSQIFLQNQETFSLIITNRSTRQDNVFFQITCQYQSTVDKNKQTSGYRPRDSFCFPRWLKVTPAAGMIKSGEDEEILVHQEEFRNLENIPEVMSPSKRSEETREEEVFLMINVKSSGSTKVRTHKVQLSCRFSTDAVCILSRNSSTRNEGGSHHRSNSSRRNEGSTNQRSNSSIKNEGSSHHRSALQQESVSNGSRRNEGSSHPRSSLQQESTSDMNKYK